MADLADLQADLTWYLPLKSEIKCKQTKRLKKKNLLKQVHNISWKIEKDLEAKPFKEVNFLPVSFFELLSQFSLNIPSYVPLYEIYNHYSINCFASPSEENCAKIISPDECSGTKGSEKIAGHFFFHDTEFQMPKLNTGIIKAFLTYLPFTEKNILPVRPTI